MAKKKILVVDDETNITRFLKFVLEKSGIYEVECENSGLNAFAKIKEAHPDILILDVNFPDVSGGEIATTIARDPSLNKIPIIFLTGNVTNEEALGGLKIGGYPALGKPINIEMLLSCIEQSLK